MRGEVMTMKIMAASMRRCVVRVGHATERSGWWCLVLVEASREEWRRADEGVTEV
jgi:hypothetical protein